MELIEDLDRICLFWIQQNLMNEYLSEVMIAFSALGDGGFIWIFFGLVCICSKNYRQTGIVIFIALLFNVVVGETILKNLIMRERPYIDYPAIALLISEPGGYSFPSGHTFSSFAAATAISRSVKFYGRTAVFLLAFCIGFSRVYLFVHYPCDVIAGVVLGIIFGMISWKIFFYLRNLIYVVILSFLKRKFMKLGK